MSRHPQSSAADLLPDLVAAGTEAPADLAPSAPRELERSFAFIDVCSFTAFTETVGPSSSVEFLERFRRVVRDIAARRSVRVTAWLGDGAMLVGLEPGPVVATAVEVVGRFSEEILRVRAGVASGSAVLFDGDDYIGRPVNLAARLCAAADPGVVLAAPGVIGIPDWVELIGSHTETVRGVGIVDGVAALVAADDVTFPPI